MSNSLREQLEAIYVAHQALTPALLVDLARDQAHPLHDRFEWDNRIAGEAWRREQAHKLISSVRVAYRPDDKPQDTVRAFHAVRTEDGVGYHPAEKVAHDPFLARLVLADMEREWKQLRSRYETFTEFWQMINRDTAA